jgi:trigger factor
MPGFESNEQEAAMTQSALEDDITQQDEAFDYPVEVEEAGPATKKVHVKIPRERIATFAERSLGQIRGETALPGFRRGKVPRHLLEKRFGKALRDQVQQDLIRESYQHALAKNNITPISEPEFENPEGLKLPDNDDFSYTFTIEVAPDFEMPSFDDLKLRKPKIAIKDEHVQQALQNLREQQGSLVPVEDRGVREKDYIIADVDVKAGDETIAHQHDAQLIARPGRIAGIEIQDFAQRLEGSKIGEERIIEVTAPENHANEKIRGKTVQIRLKLKDIKALQPAEIDPPFLESLGFANEQELLEALREQMIERVETDIQNALRRQVQDHIVAGTKIVLPKRLSDRQVDRVVNRRAVNLLMRGVPRERVQQNIEQLKEGAGAEAHRDLTLFFVLQKLAQDKQIEVSEDEVNGQVAMIALDQGQRPSSVRERMQKDGTLANLHLQLVEQKTLDAIVSQANIEEFEPTPEEERQTVDAAAGGEQDAAEDVT